MISDEPGLVILVTSTPVQDGAFTEFNPRSDIWSEHVAILKKKAEQVKTFHSSAGEM